MSENTTVSTIPSNPSEKRIILVTGGSGLVGQNLKSLITSSSSSSSSSSATSSLPWITPNDEFIFLASKDADLRNKEETFQLFAKYKPYAVIHLAAFVGGLFKNMRLPVEFYRYVVLSVKTIFFRQNQERITRNLFIMLRTKSFINPVL